SSFFTHTATTSLYTLSLHDALPIYSHRSHDVALRRGADRTHRPSRRVCRGDLPCRHRIGAAWPDPRFVGARHVALADPTAQTKRDRKSTRLNSSHVAISYAVFCLKK